MDEATRGGLTRRAVGSGVTALTTGVLRRRLDELEHRLTLVVPPSPGCATCRTWPDHVVAYPLEPPYGPAPEAPWYCRPWARPHGDECPGCVECHPRQLWPEGFACPDCGREPGMVINVVYETGVPWRDRED